MRTIAADDQPRRFLEAARGERLEALLVLAVTTGMRRGELLALRWKDVDLERGVLAVIGSLQGDRRDRLSIDTPKSGKSRSVREPVAISERTQHVTPQGASTRHLGASMSRRHRVTGLIHSS